MRQNKVIERIIEHYWYLLHQKESDTSGKLATQFVFLIYIAINHYCQVLNLQLLVVSVACQEDVGNIVVYQNVGVHSMINLGKKHL